ncbi:MAG: hypothetical protein QXT57_03035 [Thermosphaera sp.]
MVKRKRWLVSVWLPEELYGHFKAAKTAYGFGKNSDFARYIIRRWLEEHWFPRPQLSPPAGADEVLRGPTPGYEPGLEHDKTVKGVGNDA